MQSCLKMSGSCWFGQSLHLAINCQNCKPQPFAPCFWISLYTPCKVLSFAREVEGEELTQGSPGRYG